MAWLSSSSLVAVSSVTVRPSHRRSQFGQPLALRFKLCQIALAEFGELFGVVLVPLAQFVARREVLHPRIELSEVLDRPRGQSPGRSARAGRRPNSSRRGCRLTRMSVLLAFFGAAFVFLVFFLLAAFCAGLLHRSARPSTSINSAIFLR